MYYIGLDVHKKTISFCIKDASGRIHEQGTILATRTELDRWMKTLPQPCPTIVGSAFGVIFLEATYGFTFVAAR